MQFSADIKLIFSPEATVLANMHVPRACENYFCQHFQSKIRLGCSFRQVQMWMLLQILMWLTFKARCWSDEDEDVENPEMEEDYEKNDEKGRLVQMWTLAWNFDLTDTQTQSRFWPPRCHHHQYYRQSKGKLDFEQVFDLCMCKSSTVLCTANF